MGVYKVIYDKESNKIYEGEFEGEVRDGRGSLYYPSGEIKYVGEWSNDVPDGSGVLFYENGMKFYEGEWKNGVAAGQGVLFTEEGRREYEGQFAESKKNGVGTIYYEDGSTYQGEWKDDRREGFGSLFYASGDLNYRGNWMASKKHGNGMLLNRGNMLDYQGEFFEDKRQGLGRSYYLDGKIEYDGFWENDEKSGEGVLYGVDGTKVFEGIFKDGKRVEKVQIEHSDENVEHINKDSLKKIGIDVEVYDTKGKNIMDDGTNFRFLNEDSEDEIEEYPDIEWDEGENEYDAENFEQCEEISYNEEESILEDEDFEELNELNVSNTLDLTAELGSVTNNMLEEFEDDISMIPDKKSINFVIYDEHKENEKKVMSYVNDEIEEIVHDVKNQNEIQEETPLSKSVEEIEIEIESEDVEINKEDDKEAEEFYVEEDDEIEEIEEETESEIEKKEIKSEVCSEKAIGKLNKEENFIDKNEKEIKSVVNDEQIEKKETVEVRVEEDKVYKYIEIGDTVYKGEFNEGDRTGYGKVYYKGSLQYKGFIKAGVYDGRGKLYDLDEKIEFEGMFKNGKKNGMGTNYDSFGNPIYIGEWKNDLQDGDGELLNSNGEKIYKGMFYKGKALGLGISIENEIDNILYCELESMVGLEEVKDDVARLVSFLKMQILRQRVSYKPMDIPYVFTFEGNIGVGKETVARILGKLYYILGLIPEYNFIQRDLLTALEYSHDGEIEKSMDKFGGGVLYLSNLYQSNYEDITEIIKSKISTDNILDLVEYSNGHFIIVFSGDEELIETMIHNKKELARCVGKSITFFDYSVEEMMDYILGLSTEKDYILSSDLMEELESFFTELLENEKYNNRNGEFINELFTELVKEQCIRIDTYGVTDIENLRVLELQDFKNIENKICF
ncbi:MAG: hypothetical protein ACRCWM_12880 [Sarcina sp.]